MNLIPALLVAGLMALTLLLFGRQLRRERFDVANKGVNQPEPVTLLRAAARTFWLEFRYALPFYLLLAFYFYLHIRRDCRHEPDTRLVYERASTVDHIGEALAWPVTVTGEARCEP